MFTNLREMIDLEVRIQINQTLELIFVKVQ